MKRTISILLLILFSAVYCFGQKETNYWFFGHNAGLNFSKLQSIRDDSDSWTNDMPVALSGPIKSSYGCFSLADANGDLLMSSDGAKVYNKNNKRMPNGSGLKGSSLATQSGIIIPMPGNDFKYYLVTVGSKAKNPQDGINYSIVDMTADGGLGDVIEKNKPLYNVSTDENIASVRKPDTDDYWLIHGEYNNSTQKLTVYVWELTSSGFSAIPKKYSIHVNILTSVQFGYLKFSSDATRFVSPLGSNNFVLSGVFNPNTGEVNDIRCRQAWSPSSSSNAYSVEFSFSGEQIFLTDSNNKKGYHITWDNLRNTPLNVTDINFPLTNIQIASDGRIYGIEKDTRNLYVIMEPEKGALSDIRKFSNFLTKRVGFGLPTFASTWFAPNSNEDNVFCATFCMNMEHEFTFEIKKDANADNLSYTIWNFGDDKENCIIKDYDFTPDNKQAHKYTYTCPGKYTITVRSYDDKDKLLETQTMGIEVRPCVLPLNPNIHLNGVNSISVYRAE